MDHMEEKEELLIQQMTTCIPIQEILSHTSLAHPYLPKHWNLYKPVPWLQLLHQDLKISLNVLSGNVSHYKWGRRKMCHEITAWLAFSISSPTDTLKADLEDPWYDLIILK